MLGRHDDEITGTEDKEANLKPPLTLTPSPRPTLEPGLGIPRKSRVNHAESEFSTIPK